MTAKNVTWLGEDQGTSPGPSFNIWGQAISGTMTCYFKFDKGVPVLIDDEAGTLAQRQLAEHILAQAGGNRFFTVEDPEPEEPPPDPEEPPPEDDDETTPRAHRAAHPAKRKR
jgi:hypothetical protein